jgi:hypothetical protein
LLYTPAYQSWRWNPPFVAPKPIIIIFFFSNLFLVTVPFFPPSGGRTYVHLVYWVSAIEFEFLCSHLDIDYLYYQAHPVGGFVVSIFGVSYWYVWCRWLPKRNGYELEREEVLQQDGISRFIFKKVPDGRSNRASLI